MRGKQRASALALGLLLAGGAVALLLRESDGDPEVAARSGQPGADAPEAAPGPASPHRAASAELPPAARPTASPAPTSDRTPPPARPEDDRTRGTTGAAATPDPLPRQADGAVDLAALGLTGKEAGVELLLAADRTPSVPVEYGFEVGDGWEVETYYRSLQAGDGQVWSAPSVWRFHVEREDRFQGEPCLVVAVTLVSDGSGAAPALPPATFYVSRTQRRLLGADLSGKRGGELKHDRVAYARGDQPAASAAAGSIVPFDLPPRGAPGRQVRGSGLPRLDPVEAADRARFPAPADLLGAGRPYIELEFPSPSDGQTVRQRWSPDDLRWPVESHSAHRRSYRRR